jgi:hypothetical protein
VSISSNITVFVLSAFVKMVFIASITLEISPPEATFARDLSGSDIFVDIKNSTLSIPFSHSSQS